MCLISLHRIPALKYTYPDDIDEVDKIDTDDRHSGRDLSACYDRESRYEESEDDRSWVSHDGEPSDIESRNEECHWYEDREKYEDELAIFLTRFGRICDIELDCEKAQYHKTDERKSSRESRDTIRKIDTIEY